MNLDLVPPFAWGFVIGAFLVFILSTLWVGSRFRFLQERPCIACGRPSAVLAQVVDLETRRPNSSALLCEPCANHARGAVLDRPPPWAVYWGK